MLRVLDRRSCSRGRRQGSRACKVPRFDARRHPHGQETKSRKTETKEKAEKALPKKALVFKHLQRIDIICTFLVHFYLHH